MPRFAKVIVDSYLDKALDYEIPSHLSTTIGIGSRVRVPLRNRSVLGIVTGFADHSDVPNIRPIQAVLGERPLVPPILLKLAEWMSNYYLCSLDAAIRTVLPYAVRNEKIRQKTTKFLKLRRSFTNHELDVLAKRSPRQAQILRILSNQPNCQIEIRKLEEEIGKAGQHLRRLSAAGFVEIFEQAVNRDPYANQNFLQDTPRTLNPAQQKAFLSALEAIANPASSRPLLLHGVTGSGKTEVYLQLVQHVLNIGKSAIILIPEISLAPQTVERFKSRFSPIQNQIAVLHSNLSEGQRHDEWFKVLRGEARIVIGARSALFAPLNNLGILIVDEEHDPSYKQEETPRYNARDLAIVRSRLEPCAILLGSATPSVESYHNAQSEKYALIELPERVDEKKLPIIRILDMKVHNRKKGSLRGIFAPYLLEAIQKRLQKNEQVILFLNRRGHSTFLQCPSCGYVEMCSNCSISLTYHRTCEKLICHICGQTKRIPTQCPKCSNRGILFSGLGTQKLEDLVQKEFPTARIIRMDSDTMTARDAHRQAFSKFRSQQADILIGTQMIAKGLDFPNVTLVGIVNADLSLYHPDFRAGERTFQLLTQVAGRAGRGDTEGEVIIQTYSPENPAIQFARRHDFLGFWEQEKEFRECFGHPPFRRMILLTLSGEKENHVEFLAKSLWRNLSSKLPPDCNISEPVPAPLSKAKGAYRFQLILRLPKDKPIYLHNLKSLLSSFSIPSNFSLTVDVDPYNLL